MAADYEEVRPDFAAASEKTLKDVQQADAPDAKSVVAELEETDLSDGVELPGAIVEEELSVEVLRQAADEFHCASCFTIRHRSQAVQKTGLGAICRDCASKLA